MCFSSGYAPNTNVNTPAYSPDNSQLGVTSSASPTSSEDLSQYAVSSSNGQSATQTPKAPPQSASDPTSTPPLQGTGLTVGMKM